jgi:hypothetical protein
MHRLSSFLYIVVFATALLSSAITGCTARARYYDAPHSDYHRWGAAEREPYSRWESDQHRRHEDYKRRKKEDQQAYWNWRHDHP